MGVVFIAIPIGSYLDSELIGQKFGISFACDLQSIITDQRVWFGHLPQLLKLFSLPRTDLAEIGMSPCDRNECYCLPNGCDIATPTQVISTGKKPIML